MQMTRVYLLMHNK